MRAIHMSLSGSLYQLFWAITNCDAESSQLWCNTLCIQHFTNTLSKQMRQQYDERSYRFHWICIKTFVYKQHMLFCKNNLIKECVLCHSGHCITSIRTRDMHPEKSNQVRYWILARWCRFQAAEEYCPQWNDDVGTVWWWIIMMTC